MQIANSQSLTAHTKQLIAQEIDHEIAYYRRHAICGAASGR